MEYSKESMPAGGVSRGTPVVARHESPKAGLSTTYQYIKPHSANVCVSTYCRHLLSTRFEKVLF